MTLKSKIILSTAISALILSACGGGSGSSSGTTTPTTPATDNTAPTVTFNPTSLTVDSEATGESSLTATDNVSVTTGPTVSCTNGGSFSGSTFTAPTIIAETTSVCTATARDAAGNEGSATLTVTVTALDTAAPVVSFAPASLTVASGETGESSLTATDNVSVTTGPTVSCTNGGSFSGSTFTAPTVIAETTSVCTATASDAAGNEGSATLTVTTTPPPPPQPSTFTLQGHVVKGAILGAPLGILDAVNPISDADSALVESVTAADGSYSLTIPESTQVSDLLIVSSLLGSAQMICDAANCLSEGGINFGDPLLIPADSDPNFTKFLSAAIPTPAAFGTTEVNVNMFSHYQVLDMLGVSLARQGAGGTPTIFLQDYAAARQSTAAIFGLPDADFFAIPFVDITQPITSTDSNAIYAALVSGGLLGAALEAADPFAAIFDLQNRTAQDNFIARESVDNPEMISLQDIFENATALATHIGATGNAFTNAQTAVSDREALIMAAPADRPVAFDGMLPQFETDLTFLSDSRVFSTTNTGALLSVVNPDNLNYTVTLESGAGSEFFDVSFDTVNLMNLSINNPPAGSYTLTVTFDTAEGEPNTDTIDIIVNAPEIGIVEDSVTISKAQTDPVILNINNPDNFGISGISISGTGNEFFVVANSGANTAELSLNSANEPPVGTYNLIFDIESPTVGADGSDSVEVIVDP